MTPGAYRHGEGGQEKKASVLTLSGVLKMSVSGARVVSGFPGPIVVERRDSLFDDLCQLAEPRFNLTGGPA